VKIGAQKSKVEVRVILLSQKGHVNVLNLSNKVKILDLLKGSIPLVEVGLCFGGKEPSTSSTALSCMHSEYL
jgi:hypothetical protein